MQLSTIEQQVIANMHGLPPDKQQSILDFSLRVINSVQNHPVLQMEAQSAAFIIALQAFLKEVELEPLEIDTALFDRDRPQESGRPIDL